MTPPVLWIGGPPAAGKTTVARLLAHRYGLRWYNADTRTWEHRDRACAAGHPAALRFEELSPTDRWSVPPPELLAMSLHHERGAMIAEDVRALPPAPLTVAEGTPVTPAAVDGGDRDRAVWLLPSAELQRARLEERGMAAGGAFDLYVLLRDEIEQQVTACGARTITVDAGHGVEETAAAVEKLFAPALARGPVAATPRERRALLRYENRAVVEQHAAFFARPWARGDTLTAVRPFACECAREGCDAEVPLAVADFPPPPDATSPPLLAEGHAAD